MSAGKPNGKLKYLKTEIKHTQHAIHFTVYFEDEDSAVWTGRGSQFLFDLKRGDA